MRIFEGVPLGSGVKWEWGGRWLTTAIFGDLAGYVFENFGDMAKNNIYRYIYRYATNCVPVTDCKMNDLEWPWVDISCQNPFSARTFWIKAFKYGLCDSALFCALKSQAWSSGQIASLSKYALLPRCFSAVAELLVDQDIDLVDNKKAVLSQR